MLTVNVCCIRGIDRLCFALAASVCSTTLLLDVCFGTVGCLCCRYYRSVVCALALAATASLRAQGSSSSSTQAAATLHLQAAKVRLLLLLLLCHLQLHTVQSQALLQAPHFSSDSMCTACAAYLFTCCLLCMLYYAVLRCPCYAVTCYAAGCVSPCCQHR